MADINKFVKELWQRTYRNQDIDYIQARFASVALHADSGFMQDATFPGIPTPQAHRVMDLQTTHPNLRLADCTYV